MEYINKKLEEFYVTGISVRTTNREGKSLKDIADLFHKYLAENVTSKIPGRVSDDMYCVYTDYESDSNGMYTTVVGCRVKAQGNIPAGMTGITIAADTYRHYVSKGKLPDCVLRTWEYIWNSDIKRKYAFDFDVYGPKAENPENAEVETYLSV